MQNDGELFFASGGVLIVHGSELKMLPGSLIDLGNGTLVSRGNLVFHNSGVFEAGSGTIEFSGVTWENKAGATFDAGSSTVIFNGDGPQTLIVDSASSFSFNNLQVESGVTLSISGDLVISGDCILADGAYVDVGSGSTLVIEGSFQGDLGAIGGGGNTTLPVQLSSFTVAANRLNADLRWSTETEVNNYGFQIERRVVRTDNSRFTIHDSQWTSIGFVQGSGTSSSPKTYSFADNLTTPGRYAYRLKQIDFDGTFAYYSASEIEIGIAPSELMLGSNYPNPFNPTTNIEFTIPQSGKATLRVFNMIGQEVATLFEETAEGGRIYQVTFLGSTLPSGLYFYRLEYGNQSAVKRMMLVK